MKWRPVSNKRARKLRKRGEWVWYRPDLGQMAWAPLYPWQRAMVCMIEQGVAVRTAEGYKLAVEYLKKVGEYDRFMNNGYSLTEYVNEHWLTNSVKK